MQQSYGDGDKKATFFQKQSRNIIRCTRHFIF